MIVPEYISLGQERVFRVEREHAWPSGYGGFLSSECALLICPTCTTVWGRLTIATPDHPKRFRAVEQYCEGCRQLADRGVPGSLLYSFGAGCFDEPLLAALPEELLKRELLLHLAAFHKEQDHEQQGGKETDSVGGVPHQELHP